jgi:hypothetical protein
MNYGTVTYGRLPDEPEYIKPRLVEGFPILASGQSLKLSLIIGRGDFSKIRIGKAFAQVYGIVEYRDIFGLSRQPVRFCYSYSGDGGWRIGELPAYDSQFQIREDN